MGKIVINAAMIGFTVVLGIMVIIPIPGTFGFVTPADVGILTAAILLGPVSGLVVGGFSGLLIDLLTGYLNWAPFSLIIHGLEGLAAGLIAAVLFNRVSNSITQNSKGESPKYNALKLALAIPSVLVGSVIMVLGYFGVSWVIYGLGAAIASVPANIGQCVLGIIGAMILLRAALTPAIAKRIELLKQ